MTGFQELFQKEEKAVETTHCKPRATRSEPCGYRRTHLGQRFLTLRVRYPGRHTSGPTVPDYTNVSSGHSLANLCNTECPPPPTKEGVQLEPGRPTKTLSSYGRLLSPGPDSSPKLSSETRRGGGDDTAGRVVLVPIRCWGRSRTRELTVCLDSYFGWVLDSCRFGSLFC